MLDKRGNSYSQERINLVNRFIKLFGKEAIQSIVTDREFVFDSWLVFLNREKTKYYIRIRNNFKVELPHKNKSIKTLHLFNAYPTNKFVYYPKIVSVNGQICYLSGCKLQPKKTKQDFLIIVLFNAPEIAMKSSGFDIENTHLQNIKRIEKLVLLIMIALV